LIDGRRSGGGGGIGRRRRPPPPPREKIRPPLKSDRCRLQRRRRPPPPLPRPRGFGCPFGRRGRRAESIQTALFISEKKPEKPYFSLQIFVLYFGSRFTWAFFTKCKYFSEIFFKTECKENCKKRIKYLAFLKICSISLSFHGRYKCSCNLQAT